jgi:hypothetical protein
VFLHTGLPGASAEEDWLKKSVLKKEAIVRAVVGLCDRLELVDQPIADVLSMVGTPVDNQDETALLQRVEELTPHFARYDREALCLAAEIMWGPDGVEYANRVRMR